MDRTCVFVLWLKIEILFTHARTHSGTPLQENTGERGTIGEKIGTAEKSHQCRETITLEVLRKHSQ